jgi:hypothetical protein
LLVVVALPLVARAETVQPLFSIAWASSGELVLTPLTSWAPRNIASVVVERVAVTVQGPELAMMP